MRYHCSVMIMTNLIIILYNYHYLYCYYSYYYYSFSSTDDDSSDEQDDDVRPSYPVFTPDLERPPSSRFNNKIDLNFEDDRDSETDLEIEGILTVEKNRLEARNMDPAVC